MKGRTRIRWEVVGRQDAKGPFNDPPRTFPHETLSSVNSSNFSDYSSEYYRSLSCLHVFCTRTAGADGSLANFVHTFRTALGNSASAVAVNTHGRGHGMHGVRLFLMYTH